MLWDNAIKALRGLIRVAEDGEKGFAEAAMKLEPRDLVERRSADCGTAVVELKALFEQRSVDCGTAVVELRRLVQSLGGSDTLSGDVLSGWINTRIASGDTNLAVLGDVERAEEKAEAIYAEAMTITLPHQIRRVLQNQHDGTVRNHKLILSLRNSYRAANDTVNN